MIGNIFKKTGDNLGGLKTIEFCEIDFVNSIPDPVNGQINSAVSFKATGGWCEFYATFETVNLSQKNTSGSQGDVFEIIINGFIPNQSLVMDNQFAKLDNSKVILKVTDNNGHILLVGRMEKNEIYGTSFSCEYNSQSKVSGLKGTSFQFRMLSPVRAYYYNVQGSGSGS